MSDITDNEKLTRIALAARFVRDHHSQDIDDLDNDNKLALYDILMGGHYPVLSPREVSEACAQLTKSKTQCRKKIKSFGPYRFIMYDFDDIVITKRVWRAYRIDFIDQGFQLLHQDYYGRRDCRYYWAGDVIPTDSDLTLMKISMTPDQLRVLRRG